MQRTNRNVCVLLVAGFILTLLLLAGRRPDSLQYWNFRDETPHGKEVASLVGKYIRDVRSLKGITHALGTYDYQMSRELGKIHDGKIDATTDYLDHFLMVNHKDKAKLAAAHAKAVSALPSDASSLFSGQGVVAIAAGPYFPSFLVALRQLRRQNANIPVELFFLTWSEYEQEYCEKVLPGIGVTCRVLEQMYGSDLVKSLGPGYPPKLLAMLSSSFENNYYMDSDSFVLSDPAQVFTKSPFKDKGLITFPDFWERTEAPAFYDIAKVTLGKRARGRPQWKQTIEKSYEDIVPQWDREGAIAGRSTDGGQLFFSKTNHFRTLLLAMFYNLHGDKVYYPMLLQGAPGHGGRETFAAAATVLRAPYYQVQTVVDGAGFWDGGDFRLNGMLQFDPVQDYRTNELRASGRVPEYFCMHANVMKLNARALFSHNQWSVDWPLLGNHRYFGQLSGVKRKIGRDIEYELFSDAQWVACDLVWSGGHVFKDWQDENLERLCKFTMDHVNWLKYNQESN